MAVGSSTKFGSRMQRTPPAPSIVDQGANMYGSGGQTCTPNGRHPLVGCACCPLTDNPLMYTPWEARARATIFRRALLTVTTQGGRTWYRIQYFPSEHPRGFRYSARGLPSPFAHNAEPSVVATLPVTCWHCEACADSLSASARTGEWDLDDAVLAFASASL